MDVGERTHLTKQLLATAAERDQANENAKLLQQERDRLAAELASARDELAEVTAAALDAQEQLDREWAALQVTKRRVSQQENLAAAADRARTAPQPVRPAEKGRARTASQPRELGGVLLTHILTLPPADLVYVASVDRLI